jgi:hypothetical protein
MEEGTHNHLSPVQDPHQVHPTEILWQHVRSTMRRPHEKLEASHVFEDYEKRGVFVRLALRSAYPTSCHRLAEEHGALLAEDPLLLSSSGEKHRHDHESARSLQSRPVTSTSRAPTPPISFRRGGHITEQYPPPIRTCTTPRRCTLSWRTRQIIYPRLDLIPSRKCQRWEVNDCLIVISKLTRPEWARQGKGTSISELPMALSTCIFFPLRRSYCGLQTGTFPLINIVCNDGHSN